MKRWNLPPWCLLVAMAILVTAASPAAAGPSQDGTLIIATRHAPPFAIRTPAGWDGITVELVRRIAQARGLAYEFKEMGLDEMVDAVAEGEADAAAAALTVTAEREARVDFTHPFFTSGLGIAVPRRAELTALSVLKGMISSAFLQAAGALLGVLTLIGVLMWLAERRRNQQFPTRPIDGVGSGIWWSAVTMTTVGYGDKAPVTLPGRILGLFWMFASIIIISGFTAAIATSLTVGQLDQSVRGIDDLYGKRVLTAEASTSAAYLDQKLVRYEPTETVAAALDALASGQAEAVIYDLPILRYLVSDAYSDRLRVLPNQLARQDYGIALPPESPMREDFNREILRIIRTPDWSRLLEGYFGPEG